MIQNAVQNTIAESYGCLSCPVLAILMLHVGLGQRHKHQAGIYQITSGKNTNTAVTMGKSNYKIETVHHFKYIISFQSTKKFKVEPRCSLAHYLYFHRQKLLACPQILYLALSSSKSQRSVKYKPGTWEPRTKTQGGGA